MSACRNRSLNVFQLSSPVSVRTFVEHLSALTTTRFNPNRTNGKPLTTKAAIRTHFFESLNPLQKEQIHLYADTLLQWNRKMNLTAVTEASEVMERHVEDSLAILPPIRSSYSSHCEASYDNLNLVDVGSGAGLPGLILAIACPGWKVTLLESINKRCLFLEHAVGVIGLPNVQVIRERAENFGQNLAFRETFDIAVARAVAELRVLAEYCLPLVRVGGLFVAAKGHDPLEEVSTAKRAIQLMGASVLQIDSVESHSPYGQRTAVLCLKDRPTPKKYPRDPDMGTAYLRCVRGGQFIKPTRESLSNSDTDG